MSQSGIIKELEKKDGQSILELVSKLKAERKTVSHSLKQMVKYGEVIRKELKEGFHWVYRYYLLN